MSNQNESGVHWAPYVVAIVLIICGTVGLGLNHYKNIAIDKNERDAEINVQTQIERTRIEKEVELERVKTEKEVELERVRTEQDTAVKRTKERMNIIPWYKGGENKDE